MKGENLLGEGVNDWQAKFEPCQYSDRLINKLLLMNKATKNPVDIQEIKKAIYYAKKYHGNQMRQSGEVYYSHPLEVAYMVADYLFRTDVIVTAILHDVIEDTELTEQMIAAEFGKLVANQVQDLTRVRADGKISSAELIESLWLEKKYDVLLIKQFDRLHNLQTIGAKSPQKIKKIVEETLVNFIILSEYLNQINIAKEMRDICTKIIEKLECKTDQYVKFSFSFNDNYQPLSLIYQNAIH